ncbi:plasminogen-binding protein pgbB [Helicobacter didelphidarum]|uniref:Plasminogen-binding protein pgbB n=1 Tax=Helicobacter didelphidarum TaxID=2040648 RepID=A0A3D8IJU2_9HELI|nr:plasminogen-binding protein pgbB [Helicobacter didelphidarum]RDU64934.1 plasminogen-binding protein pgbB [Helicobacter didelphidarum]
MNIQYNKLFPIVAFITFFLGLNVGCDAQKNFKPEIIKGKISFNGKLNKKIIMTNRETAKLKDNSIIMYAKPRQEGENFTLNNTQSLLIPNILEDKENLLFHDSTQWIIANGCKSIRIIPLQKESANTQDSKTKDSQSNSIKLDRASVQEIDMQGCVVAASIKDFLIAGVLGDNTIFLYDLMKQDFIFREKGEAIYAISSFVANPVMMDTLAIFPTLDGRLHIVDMQQFKSVKNIIVNTDKFLNNIIYLRVEKDELVAATQKRLYILMRGESYNKDIEIRDIYFDGQYIYILSLNGFVYQFDKTLQTIHSIKLPYANLNGILIKNNHLYTFENSGGYFIDLNLSDFQYDVYQLQFGTDRWFSKESTIFYTPNILYINKRILDINRDYKVKIREKKQQKSK